MGRGLPRGTRVITERYTFPFEIFNRRAGLRLLQPELMMPIVQKDIEVTQKILTQNATDLSVERLETGHRWHQHVEIPHRGTANLQFTDARDRKER